MDGKTDHIMVIASDQDERDDLRQLLQEDFDVSFWDESSEALPELSASSAVKMVIIVGALAEAYGPELLRTIRRLPAICDLPVLILADAAEPEIVAKAFEAGASDYIARPVDDRVLLASIRARFAQRDLAESYKRRIARLTQSTGMYLKLMRMASHDLKSPLNNIRIAENILRLNAPDRLETAQSLDMIRLMVDNMNEIISNFLDMIELQAGQLQLSLKPVSLNNVIANVISQYSFAAQKKSILLHNRASDGWVLADARRLVQVVGNLVNNAIKYSPYQSEVNIHTASRDGRGIITVEDHGAGVPEQERHRLFQEYGRLSTRPTGGESSSGLGLWIVKHLMYAQNGSVGAEFPENGGSRFWISLPECSPDTYQAVDNVRAQRTGLFPANKEEAVSTRARGSSDDSAGDG